MSAGETGDALADLVLSELQGKSDLEQRILANRIFAALAPWQLATTVRVPTPPLIPMGLAEASEYEQTTLGFGSHKDVPIQLVPTAYLEWLADACRDTWKNLHRYLNNPIIRQGRLSRGV